MDAVRYLAAKKKKQASIVAHGKGETILVSMPGGYDPGTGAALPKEERGYQKADIKAMCDACDEEISRAEDALDKALERKAAFQEVMKEIEAL